MLCTLEWLGLVPPRVAPFSFEMDVVLLCFLLCISLHPLIFMYVHMCSANVCVCPCIHLSVCVCGGVAFVCVQVLMVRVSSDSQSTGLESTSLTCQIRAKVVV